MRGKLNADGIDESEWLPRNAPPINAYRYAKGDLRHDEETGCLKSFTPIDDLHDRGILEDTHKYAANEIASLFVVAYRFLGFRVMQEIVHELQTGKDSLNGGPADKLKQVMQALTLPQRNIAIRICYDMMREHEQRTDYTKANYAWVGLIKGSVQTTFEAAAKRLDELYESDNMQIVTKPEVSLKSGDNPTAR